MLRVGRAVSAGAFHDAHDAAEHHPDPESYPGALQDHLVAYPGAVNDADDRADHAPHHDS
jgi:hypothetical protein